VRDVKGMWNVWGTGFWWGGLRQGDHLEGLGVDGRILLKWILKKSDRETWTGLMWFSVGTGGGLF